MVVSDDEAVPPSLSLADSLGVELSAIRTGPDKCIREMFKKLSGPPCLRRG